MTNKERFLADLKRLEEVQHETPEDWCDGDVYDFGEQLTDYWLTLSWTISIFKGEAAWLSTASLMPYLTIRLDTPWNGIETVSGPIDQFTPVEYETQEFKGAWE